MTDTIDLNGNWIASRQYSVWKLNIRELNRKLTGKCYQITILGDILDYELTGFYDGNLAKIQLVYTRNPLIQANLDLRFLGNALTGGITEGDGVTFDIEFRRDDSNNIGNDLSDDQ